MHLLVESKYIPKDAGNPVNAKVAGQFVDKYYDFFLHENCSQDSIAKYTLRSKLIYEKHLQRNLDEFDKDKILFCSAPEGFLKSNDTLSISKNIRLLQDHYPNACVILLMREEIPRFLILESEINPSLNEKIKKRLMEAEAQIGDKDGIIVIQLAEHSKDNFKNENIIEILRALATEAIDPDSNRAVMFVGPPTVDNNFEGGVIDFNTKSFGETYGNLFAKEFAVP